MYKWVDFPFKNSGNSDTKNCDYLYVVGGFYSPDDGCPAWGTSDSKRIRAIGDNMGYIVISFTDGSVSKIPLIFGYTLWYHSIWNERPAPFFGEGASEELIGLLKSSLMVKGAYEGDQYGVIRIKLDEREISEITIENNPEKEGNPVFVGGYICENIQNSENAILTGGQIEVNAMDDFFTGHTICMDNVYPSECSGAIDKIYFALRTFEKDFEEAPIKFVFPEEKKVDEYRIVFSGNRLAEIANGVVYYNMINLNERTDDDGFIHTSYKDAPSWRYDGFGPYVLKANSYYDSFYSRDGARAIMSLNSYGYIQKANSGCEFGNKWMMYYPEQGLKIKDEPIPGHFSVIPNKPLIYSTLLSVVAGWPTQYTQERFGSGYQNLGNQETDGHGLMMEANYLVWCNSGKSVQWVEKNWKYINEAAVWIKWCQEKPDLSFARDGLLYGETEAAMNTYTLYANVPCYLGLLGYAEMARAIGKDQEATEWEKCAEIIRREIDKQLTQGDGWNLEHKGFTHDPVPTMLSDYYGYDNADMPSDWISRSNVSYDHDILWIRTHGHFGPGGGVGYDHSMITQNALLLDQMKDGSKLIENLCKLSYSPRLPEPYMVPEGLCVDLAKGAIFRQGDLGNLVQLAEAMKCYLIVAGVSPVTNGTLKIMPRLPENWNVSIEDFKIQNTDSTISMSVSYPENDTQTATVDIKDRKEFKEVSFRFGPFSADCKEAKVTLNGVTHSVTPYLSGDSKWAWIKL